MHDVKASIREYVVSRHLRGQGGDLHDDTPLVTSGILDSLALLELVSHLEQQFGVELDVYDTSVDAFDSLDDIAAAVTRKRLAVSADQGEPV